MASANITGHSAGVPTITLPSAIWVFKGTAITVRATTLHDEIRGAVMTRNESVSAIGCGVALLVLAGSGNATDIDAKSFRCITKMTPVRQFYVDNLQGHLDATVAATISTPRYCCAAGFDPAHARFGSESVHDRSSTESGRPSAILLCRTSAKKRHMQCSKLRPIRSPRRLAGGFPLAR